MRAAMIPSSEAVRVRAERVVMARDVVVSLDTVGRFVVSWIDAGDTVRKHAFSNVDDANRLAHKLREKHDFAR